MVRPVLGFGPAKLLSAATTSDVGKVVCADGHLRDAKTAVPAGGTAVGILGKVTETGHGLILALQDATAQTGNTIINVWTSTTDYASTPNTKWGKLVFGVGCGLITVLIRFWGNYPEGVSYSILIMNILTPYIAKLTRSKPLIGGVEQ